MSSAPSVRRGVGVELGHAGKHRGTAGRAPAQSLFTLPRTGRRPVRCAKEWWHDRLRWPGGYGVRAADGAQGRRGALSGHWRAIRCTSDKTPSILSTRHANELVGGAKGCVEGATGFESRGPYLIRIGKRIVKVFLAGRAAGCLRGSYPRRVRRPVLSAREIPDISALLGDPDCPWALLARSPHTKAIMVSDLLSFARQRYPDWDDAEPRFDSWVEEAGGRRIRVIDPWRALGRLRFWRERDQDSGDVYDIPREALPSVAP